MGAFASGPRRRFGARRRQAALVAAVSLAWACDDLRTADSFPPDAGDQLMDAGERGTESEAALPRDAGDAGIIAPVEERVSGRPALGALAVDDENVYYAERGGGVFACAKGSCEPTRRGLATGVTHRLAIADGRVWWGEVGSGRLLSWVIGGASDAEVILEDQPGIDDVTSDGQALVWRANGGGGAGDVLRTCPARLCAANRRIVLAPSAIAPGISAVAGTVYFGNGTTKKIYGCGLASICSTPAELGGGEDGVAVSAPDAFWLSGTSIVSCKLSGCGGLPAVVAVTPRPSSLAIDENDVYWLDAAANELRRCPRHGCTAPEVIATGIGSSDDMAVALDADHVYWTEERGLFRRHK